ncbi:MAG: hypothetical protein AVDCRST_MAG13-1312 [uncultured Solirubrobacteraceae bacterium]|uniref:Uncharacterized protein n=1 Tax=uncultured Solirubrobacteraceae bacterium TaxID=1162706 RepID=A0A6J4S118_9ACTN|nr:MAG: hypothetical protein AVDCRST_MAG13-1312 [uncultured Solirubrobacteraceae bacterium]
MFVLGEVWLYNLLGARAELRGHATEEVVETVLAPQARDAGENGLLAEEERQHRGSDDRARRRRARRAPVPRDG